MSILIKGMKMPESCLRGGCPLDGSSCTLWEKENWKDSTGPYNGRHKNCPLIPIPDHGDLIDKDALEKDFIDLSEDDWNKKTGTSWAKACEEAADVVFNAPVVIPAERGEA